jgi:radical SAM protein with 4Fe4S-binding SPASM domain
VTVPVATPAPIATPVPMNPPRAAPPAPPADQTLWTGEVLRQLREARGLSLQQLSERTKITRHHLENIEADRFGLLPAPVYLRGILLSLARELRLDGQKVARSYLERAVAAGATAVSLPNLPLFGQLLREAATATPAAAQLEALAVRIAAALRERPAIDLRVHHYGLWQALRAAGAHPHGEDAPGAGCQAGAALAYVDPAGILYPCASLPVPLARVSAGEPIAAAWAGAGLAALREGIARLPGRCGGCPCEPTCRGGCRGWAHYLSGSWDSTGPDCARP